MSPRRNFAFHRAERRIPMEIPVVLDGHRQTPGAESTFTENVSARGARVVHVSGQVGLDAKGQIMGLF